MLLQDSFLFDPLEKVYIKYYLIFVMFSIGVNEFVLCCLNDWYTATITF